MVFSKKTFEKELILFSKFGMPYPVVISFRQKQFSNENLIELKLLSDRFFKNFGGRVRLDVSLIQKM